MTMTGDGHDLGLSEAQEQRAAALSASCVVVDLLGPSPTEADPAPAAARAPDAPPTGPTARRVDVDPSSLGRAPKPPGAWSALPVARTVGEIRAAARDGRRVVFLGTRAATDLAGLDALHGLGLRMVGLGDRPAEVPADGSPVTDANGLTTSGTRLLRRLDQLGIVVDVAGADHATAFDVAMRSAHPIVASRALVSGRRPGGSAAGTDELRAIASTDGAIGIGIASGPPGAQAPIEAVLDRVDQVAGLVGSRYVALGLGSSLTASGPLDGPALTRGLVARGYADDEIRGILGENALRVFAAVWG